jgi:CRISPR/Cas system-associated protein endoribonuclease Cas2
MLKLYEEVKQAKEQLDQAWQNFEYAEPDFIDIASLEVTLAQKKYVKLSKKLGKLVFDKKEITKWNKLIKAIAN